MRAYYLCSRTYVALVNRLSFYSNTNFRIMVLSIAIQQEPSSLLHWEHKVLHCVSFGTLENAILWQHTSWKWNIQWCIVCFVHRRETDAEESQLLKHHLQEAGCHPQTWGQTGRALWGELQTHAVIPKGPEQLTNSNTFFCGPLLLPLLSTIQNWHYL